MERVGYIIKKGEKGNGEMSWKRKAGRRGRAKLYEEMRETRAKRELGIISGRGYRKEAVREKGDGGGMSVRECYEGEMRRLREWWDAGEISVRE